MAISLTGNFNNRRRNPQTFRTTKRVSANLPTEAPSYLPVLEPSCGRCTIARTNAKKTEYLLNIILVMCSFASWLLDLVEMPLQALFTSINEMYLICLILKNQHCVPYFCSIICERWKTIQLVFFTLPLSYYNDYKNVCFITNVLPGRILLICDTNT